MTFDLLGLLIVATLALCVYFQVTLPDDDGL